MAAGALLRAWARADVPAVEWWRERHERRLAEIVSGQLVEKREPVAQQARHQEAHADVFLPTTAASRRAGRVVEDLATRVGALPG